MHCIIWMELLCTEEKWRFNMLKGIGKVSSQTWLRLHALLRLSWYLRVLRHLVKYGLTDCFVVKNVCALMVYSPSSSSSNEEKGRRGL